MIREILAILFPYIVILYFIDSIQYISRVNLLFVNHFGKNYRLKKSGFHISKLSPVGTTIVSQNLPVYFTTKGLYKIKDARSFENNLYDVSDFQFISYDDIDSIEVDGKDIKINETSYLKAPSSISAKFIRDIIKKIKVIEPAKRIQKIQKIFYEILNVKKAAGLNNAYSGYLKKLKIFCAFFFVNTFIILPLILYSNLYVYLNIYLIVAFIILAYLTILILTYYTHLKVYKNEKRQRIYVLLSMIFSPVSAMHATYYISRDFFSHFNYLAVAELLLPAGIFQSLARKELSLIHQRKQLFNKFDWHEYWDLKEKSITDLIEKAGYTSQTILAAPGKQDENATSYCPVCLAEYIESYEECSDCQVGLKNYGSSPAELE